jgi:hypothetical protein
LLAAPAQEAARRQDQRTRQSWRAAVVKVFKLHKSKA